jgi:glycerophosphoryl diester phosphodiesterase
MAIPQAAAQVLYHGRCQIIGHRGARGTYPENTLPALKAAVDAQVDYIEVDVVASADGQIVISHEPWLNPEICTGPDGQPVSKPEAYNLYQMTYDEIARCDCGSKQDPRFPQQQSEPAYKPMLVEAAQEIVSYHKQSPGLTPLKWLIEVKYAPNDPHYPPLETYVDQLHAALTSRPLRYDRVIQTFSPEVLNALYKREPEWAYGLLVDNDLGVEANLAKLDFAPDYYNVHHRLVNTAFLAILEEKLIYCFAWTVNDPADAQRLKAMGISGIITDYPATLLKD